MTTTEPTNGADLTSYLQVHRCLRHSAAQLAEAVDRPVDHRRARALARWYGGYAGEVRCHHHIEDALLFPALRARVSTYPDHAVRIDRDHDDVDRMLDQLADAFDQGDRTRITSLAHALRDHLDAHLAYEDAELVPLFIRHFTGAEFDELNARAVRLTPPKQLLFTAPWLLDQLDPAERAQMLASVPRAVRLLWRCVRGRYARLTTRAFGA